MRLFRRLDPIITFLDALTIGLFGAIGATKALVARAAGGARRLRRRGLGGRRLDPARPAAEPADRADARRVALRGRRRRGHDRAGRARRPRRADHASPRSSASSVTTDHPAARGALRLEPAGAARARAASRVRAGRGSSAARRDASTERTETGTIPRYKLDKPEYRDDATRATSDPDAQRGDRLRIAESGAASGGDELLRRRRRVPRTARLTAETTALKRRRRGVGVDADAPEARAVDLELDVGGGRAPTRSPTACARRSRRGATSTPLLRAGCRGTPRSGRCPSPVGLRHGRRRRAASTVSATSPPVSLDVRVLPQLEPAPLALGVVRRARAGTRPGRSPRSASLVTSPPSASVFACTTPRELDLQLARQVERVVGLQQVGDAALAGLRVDADDRLVAAAQVLRVDRQVRHRPDAGRRRDLPCARRRPPSPRSPS